MIETMKRKTFSSISPFHQLNYKIVFFHSRDFITIKTMKWKYFSILRLSNRRGYEMENFLINETFSIMTIQNTKSFHY